MFDAGTGASDLEQNPALPSAAKSVVPASAKASARQAQNVTG
jgi:hypothetical protein